MDWLGVALFALGVVNPGRAEDPPPGRYTIQTQGILSRRPSTLRDKIRDLKIGDQLDVLSFQGAFAKVRYGGDEGFVPKCAVIPSEKYVAGPANEKEMMELKARGYEAGRFDPDTEKSRLAQNPNLKPGYDAIDRLEKDMAWASNRSSLSEELLAFQKEGKLAEFSDVKK
jgi:hypothetical protein